MQSYSSGAAGLHEYISTRLTTLAWSIINWNSEAVATQLYSKTTPDRYRAYQIIPYDYSVFEYNK